MASFVIAYGYNRDSGEYTGTVNAWEDQLTPGTYLLPANATFTEPHQSTQGTIRKWNGTAWTLQDAPPPAPTPDPLTAEQLAANYRVQRNASLLQSDWTLLSDVPLANKAEWATYRQALRDVPQQSGFPNTITWPTPPTT